MSITVVYQGEFGEIGCAQKHSIGTGVCERNERNIGAERVKVVRYEIRIKKNEVTKCQKKRVIFGVVLGISMKKK